MHRRTKLWLAAAAVPLIALTGFSSATLAATAAPDDTADVISAQLTAANFASPDSTALPWVRWTLSPNITEDEIVEELTEMQRSHVGGAEIGQGYFPTTSQLELILRTANDLGITISLSHGPVGGEQFSIDDDLARKSLTYGQAVLEPGATFSGALPTPTGNARRTLVGVSAYAATGTVVAGATTSLDLDSLADLTGAVTATNTDGVGGGSTAGAVEWQAPDDGRQWVLIALWSVGSQAQPDLLTEEGTQALIAGMEDAFAPIADLLRKNGGDLFYDSHTGDRGSTIDTWSNTMREDFEAANGYAVLPYAPLLTTLPPVGFGAALPAFTFEAGRTADFLNDFYATRTDLWLNNQILPLQDWSDEYNQSLRVQPYGQNGAAVDSIQASGVVDRVETETLWFGDQIDNYLPESSANDMLGKSWYSIEGSAVLNGAYGQTWQDQVVRMNKAFAGGVTKLVYHTYPSDTGSASTWPGYSLFPDSFSGSWGPRNANWVDASQYNDYFARSGAVLAQGAAKTDVAVYMQNYVYPQPYTQGGLQYWSDAGFERAGYSRDYLDPSLLQLPNAVVTDGRLAIDGPGYQAFIFDSTQLPTSAPSRTTVTVDVAQKMLEFAQAGLPVIIVGTAPAGAPGMDAAADDEVAARIAQLMTLDAVHVVASEADVPALLSELGIHPAAEPAEASPVMSVHRQDDTTDYYWLYNQGSPVSAGEPANMFDPLPATSTTTRFTLQGTGVPLALDTWSGDITPIPNYSTDGKSVTVDIDLGTEDTTVIALTRDPERFGVPAASPHVVSTDADAVVVDDEGGLSIVDSAPGTYHTVLADGREFTSVVGSSPAAVDLSDATWTLGATAWTPTSPGATGDAATETTTSQVTVELAGLRSWPNVAELTDASGTGTYETQFTLPDDWSADNLATLDLGEVMDSFTVSVNGVDIPFVNQLTARAEIGEYLQAGPNRISVDVATTLRNQLRLHSATQASRARQEYGLIGPVTITPMATASLEEAVDPGTGTPGGGSDSDGEGDGGGASTPATGNSGSVSADHLASTGGSAGVAWLVGALLVVAGGIGVALSRAKRRKI